MPSKVRPGVLAFAVIVLILAAAIGSWMLLSQPQPSIGGPFSLVDQDGRTVTERTYDGRIKLIMFGYTHCPDVCPTGLADMSAALELLGPKAREVQPVFISVDPERDTVPVLKNYLASFPGIVGLTGTPAQVAAVTKEYGVYVAKVSPTGGPVEAGSTDYVVDHTILIYFMGRDGEYLRFVPSGTAPAEIVKALAPFVG